jgi:hypothetical protein
MIVTVVTSLFVELGIPYPNDPVENTGAAIAAVAVTRDNSNAETNILARINIGALPQQPIVTKS